jgi:hypothetical protein
VGENRDTCFIRKHRSEGQTFGLSAAMGERVTRPDDLISAKGEEISKIHANLYANRIRSLRGPSFGSQAQMSIARRRRLG